MSDDSSFVAAEDHAGPEVRSLGLWSAALCTLLSLAYVFAQLAEWAGLLGSAGGPDSRSTTLGIAVLLTPSLLLAPAFVVLMVSVHHLCARAVRVYTHVAVAFAVMYATMVGIVYIVQLTFVMPRLARGDLEGIELLVFEPFDSFLYAVDVFGYSLMSASTLFAAAEFTGGGRLERWIRHALIANGCLIPFLALQMYFPPLIWGGALWAITFPMATWLLAVRFARLPVPTRPARRG